MAINKKKESLNLSEKAIDKTEIDKIQEPKEGELDLTSVEEQQKEMETREPENKEVAAVKEQEVKQEIPEKEKEEVLKELVTYSFKKLILEKPDDRTREVIRERLIELADEYREKFEEIDREADILRDKIVKLLEEKKLDAKICADVEKWLGLLFDKEGNIMFCKQEAKRLTEEILKEFL